MCGLKSTSWRLRVSNVASSRTTGRYCRFGAEARSSSALSVLSEVKRLPSGALGMMLINRNGGNISAGRLSVGALKLLITDWSGLLSNSVDCEVGHHSHGR